MGIDGQARVVHQVADEAVALGADDAPGGDGIVAEAVGQRRGHDRGALAAQRLDGGVVRAQHLAIHAGPLGLGQHGQAQAGHAAPE